MPETKEKPRKKRPKAGPEIRAVPTEKIQAEPDIQPRADGLHEETVAEYADLVRAGSKFPPLVVYLDDAGLYWLSEGFHRLAAYLDAGHAKVRCEVRRGTRTDALLNACGSNAQHGRRRTNADKRRAVELVLAVYPRWSARKVAEVAGVSHELAADVKRSLSAPPVSDSDTPAPAAPALSDETAPGQEGSGSDTAPAADTPPAKSWRDTPVGEAIEVKSRRVAEAIAAAGTCGELADRLNAGETFGLPNRDLQGLRDRLKELAEADPPPGPPAHTTPDPVRPAAPAPATTTPANQATAPAADPPPAAPAPDEPAEHPADAAASELAGLCRQLDAVKAGVLAYAARQPYGGHVHAESVVTQIEAARKALWQSRPTEGCNCARGGKDPAPKCSACFGTGRTIPSRVLKGGR